MGIPGIGIANAKVICRALGDDAESLLKATEEELNEIRESEVLAKRLSNILQMKTCGEFQKTSK